MLLHFRTTTVLKQVKEAGIVKRKWTWSRFLVTCCVKEKTLVVTKNPQGEGGGKGDFFWLLPYREKMQSSHSPKGGKKETRRRRHTHWSMQSGLGTRHNVNILGCCFFHIKMPIVKLALSKLLSQCAFELRKSLFPSFFLHEVHNGWKKRRKMSLDVFYRIGIKNYWPPFIYADSLARLNFIPQSQGGPTLTCISVPIEALDLGGVTAAAEDFLPAKSPLFIRESHQVWIAQKYSPGLKACSLFLFFCFITSTNVILHYYLHCLTRLFQIKRSAFESSSPLVFFALFLCRLNYSV